MFPDLAVPLSIAPYLFAPISPAAFRHDEMFGAAMPETRIKKNDCFQSAYHYIRPAVMFSAVLAVVYPFGPKRLAKGFFQAGFGSPDSAHYLATLFLGEYVCHLTIKIPNNTGLPQSCRAAGSFFRTFPEYPPLRVLRE